MMVDLYEAIKIAEDVFRRKFEGDLACPPSSWLSEQHLEADNCWLFQKNGEINLSESLPFSDFVIVVSRKGTKIINKDYQGDINLLKQYLDKISKHLKEKDK